MMLLNILLLLAASCCCVNAYCNETTVKKIQELWGKKPPRITTRQLIGTITNIYYTPWAYDVEPKKCSQTTIARDAMTAIDYDEMLEGSTRISSPYYVISEAPGIITTTGPDTGDSYLYFVYLNQRNGVYAFIQCIQSEETTEPPMSAVIAINYDKHNKDTARAIQTSLDTLKKVGLNNAPKRPLDCKTFNRHIN